MADTYDRRVQLDASRLRYKDALSLYKSGRWNGAIYLGGYVIECSLKALICSEGHKNNLKETRLYKGTKRGNFKDGVQGAALHNLWTLFEASERLDSAIKHDRTNKLKDAWNIIVLLWQKDSLRYGRELYYETECEQFLQAVEQLYFVILKKQGEDVE